MKKINFLLLSVILSMVSIQAFAYDVAVENSNGKTIYYNYVNGTELEVTSGDNNYSGDINIPANVTIGNNVYSVTNIGNNAFRSCSGLTSITIPNSVTSIGNYAFQSCSGLTSITIPNGVTSIGVQAFDGCSGLTSITIPNSVTSIGDHAFLNCSGLTSITVVDGNTVYDSRGNCDAIIKTSSNTLLYGCKNTIIPNSVTSIGNDTFYNCSGLTSITIPNSVTSIGVQAFYKCSGLTSITIPNSVTSIGNYAFRSCSGLTSITIPNSVTSIGDYAFYYCSGLTSISIPNSVTSIGRNAFSGCSGLTSISIPNSVTSIGNNAFRLCSGLTSIIVEEGNTVYDSRDNCNAIIETLSNKLISGCKNTIIPNSVTSIGFAAFYECSGLTSITIPNSVTSIGDYAFQSCKGLTSITIPNSVTSIGEYAFYNCSGLTSITIPNSVTSIGNNAFRLCSGLTSVISLIESPYSYGSSAFSYISSDCVLTVPRGTRDAYIVAGWTEDVFKGGVVEAPAIDFADANVKALCVANWDTNGDGEQDVVEAAAVTDLGEVFKNNSTITSFDELQYFTGLTGIGDDAFYRCSGLTSITIPNSVTSIGYYVFSGCSVLTSITIPNSVTSIGDDAFRGCSGLTSITIPNSVTSIGYNAFSYCSSLTSIIVEEGNTVYDSRDNCNAIIETISNKLISGCMNTVIPNSVTSIGDDAFRGCSGLTSITIPNSVTSIGEYAFSGCSGLTSITIPNSVTSIGEYAFYNCSGLTSITIPNSVTSIGEYAFYNCSGLTSITIPNSVTSIGNNAFRLCSGLTSIIVEEGNTVYDSRDNCNAIIETLSNKLISGCKNTIIPNSVTSIGFAAFYECSGLTSITIPNSVTSIGNNAFSYCSGLPSITIPNSVTSIGYSAFSGCSGLTSVISLIESPYSYGSSAFSGISSDCVLTVPRGTRDAYIAAGWTENVFKGGVVEAPAIDFADANVKALCVANWDTNGDGELDVVEAAAVTDLGEVFRYKSTITSFDELQYFTGLTSIGNNAFSYCSGLTSITIPDGVTSIGDWAFYSCSSLTSINIPDGVTSIGDRAFYGCSGLTSISIPNSVTSIGSSAFRECSGLTSITIPNSVTSIGGDVFDRCSGLTSITIPNSVTSIGDYAFNVCSGLTSITIPNSVTSIGGYAFNYCSGLTSITIPNSVTSIGDCAFRSCSGLTSVISLIESPYSFGSGAFKNISSDCVLTVPRGTRDAYIAAGWTEDVFKGGVVEAPAIDFADANVKALCVADWDTNGDGELDVVEAAAVTDLGYVFRYNSTITSFDELRYFTGLTSIGNYAFSGCSGLTSITIPNSVTSIGSEAFFGCSGLTSVASEIENPFTIPDFFSIDTYNNAILYVPEGTKDKYMTTSSWNKFKKIKGPVYKLTYMVDGIDYKTYELEQDELIVPETAPTKEGYTFSDWSEIPETMPAKDVTVTGTFSVNSYKLTYKVDGKEYKSSDVEYGSTITPEAAPTKEGYTFSGWSEIPETMPAKDVTVTGTFSVNSYKLTYMVDGKEYKSSDVEYGSTVTPETAPTMEGYTFSGWSEIPETMPAKDVVVTGTFSVISYKLTYMVDGEEYKSYVVEYGSTITPESAPKKEGYIFSGWSIIPEIMPAKDVTITGTFTKGQYKVTYIVDGAVYKTIGYDYEATITPEAAPTKEGYTFSGWSEIPATMPAKDVTVIGTFSVNSYKLTYKVDGIEYKSSDVEYGSTITPEAAPTKEGYTFSGWSEIPETMPARDVVVTGTFTINSYKLTYMVDGKEYKSSDVEYGSTISPETAPTKEGYTFSGWSEIPETMPARDVEVTGTFTINSYKLTYMVDGIEYKSYNVEYGSSITAEQEPTMEGYIFSGWSEIPETMPAEDVVVTGTFTLDTTGIDDVYSNDDNKEYYDLKGARIVQPNKGVNIIKMSDGSIKKIIIK